VRNVYHSLDSNTSLPVAESQTPVAKKLPAAAASPKYLCVPRDVGGDKLVADATFIRQLEDGQKAVATRGIVIAGLLRDDGDSTHKLLHHLHTVGSAFSHHHLIIIENDSKDSTRKNMARACQGPDASCFELKLAALGPKQDVNVPHRVKHLTWLRQQLLGQVHKFVSASHLSWEFLLMFDGDLFSEGNAGFNSMATLALFGFRQHEGGTTLAENPPDVVCSNGIFSSFAGGARFRDTFSLRVSSFAENHTTSDWQGAEAFFYKGNEMVPLKSCFSGLSLYSLPGLLQSRCDYKYEKENICEHVSFHRCLSDHGHGRVAVYPPWAIRFSNSDQSGVIVDKEVCMQHASVKSVSH